MIISSNSNKQSWEDFNLPEHFSYVGGENLSAEQSMAICEINNQHKLFLERHGWYFAEYVCEADGDLSQHVPIFAKLAEDITLKLSIHWDSESGETTSFFDVHGTRALQRISSEGYSLTAKLHFLGSTMTNALLEYAERQLIKSLEVVA